MTNIEKEIITFKIITRGTKAELGAYPQDPHAWTEVHFAQAPKATSRGFFSFIMTFAFKIAKIRKSRGPKGPQSPNILSEVRASLPSISLVNLRLVKWDAVL